MRSRFLPAVLVLLALSAPAAHASGPPPPPPEVGELIDQVNQVVIGTNDFCVKYENHPIACVPKGYIYVPPVTI